MSKPSKNIGISRKISPLRDKYTPRKSAPKPKYPPGHKQGVESTGNRYGK